LVWSKSTNIFCGYVSYEFVLPVKFSNMSRHAYWKKFCKLSLLLVLYIVRYQASKTNLDVY